MLHVAIRSQTADVYRVDRISRLTRPSTTRFYVSRCGAAMRHNADCRYRPRAKPFRASALSSAITQRQIVESGAIKAAVQSFVVDLPFLSVWSICGHMHHPADRMIDGIHYLNSGDWVESCTAIVENETGYLEVVHWRTQVPRDDGRVSNDSIVPHHSPEAEITLGANAL